MSINTVFEIDPSGAIEENTNDKIKPKEDCEYFVEDR